MNLICTFPSGKYYIGDIYNLINKEYLDKCIKKIFVEINNEDKKYYIFLIKINSKLFTYNNLNYTIHSGYFGIINENLIINNNTNITNNIIKFNINNAYEVRYDNNILQIEKYEIKFDNELFIKYDNDLMCILPSGIYYIGNPYDVLDINFIESYPLDCILELNNKNFIFIDPEEGKTYGKLKCIYKDINIFNIEYRNIISIIDLNLIDNDIVNNLYQNKDYFIFNNPIYIYRDIKTYDILVNDSNDNILKLCYNY